MLDASMLKTYPYGCLRNSYFGSSIKKNFAQDYRLPEELRKILM